MSRRGYRTMFRSESFPSCQGCSLSIVPAPDSGWQTGLCMPYGLWLRVATTINLLKRYNVQPSNASTQIALCCHHFMGGEANGGGDLSARDLYVRFPPPVQQLGFHRG